MNSRLTRFRFSVLAALVLAPLGLGKTPPAGEVAPAAKRRPSVELAQKIAAITVPAALAPESNLPFNPTAFGQPNPEEQRALQQAAAIQKAQATAPVVAVGQVRPGAADREQLAAIASQIKPSGSIFVFGEPRLMLQSRSVKIGDKFTVTYSGVDYVLELTAIDRTTFTLRLNGEAITRPIKPEKKSP